MKRQRKLDPVAPPIDLAEETTISRLATLVGEVLFRPVEDIKVETNIVRSLNADSLDIVELAMVIEFEFAIVITDEQLSLFTEEDATVGRIAEEIDKLLAGPPLKIETVSKNEEKAEA